MVRQEPTRSSLELALDTWGGCCPEGMVQSEGRILQALPEIAARVPGALDSPDTVRRLNKLFLPREDSPGKMPKFIRMLQPYLGQVHFLYFWRAFCKAAQFVAGGSGGLWEGGLVAEFDQLRDALLRVLSVQPGPEKANFQLIVCTRSIVESLNDVAQASIAPDFWRNTAGAMAGLGAVEGLGLEEIAVLMFSWLHDARAWAVTQRRIEEELARQHEEIQPVGLVAPPSPLSPKSDAGLAVSCFCLPLGKNKDAISRQQVPRNPAQAGLPVFLHIYDVSLEDGVRKLNKVLANRYSPLKLGGVFHAGVEVLGLEWSFGYSEQESVPGICCHEPRRHPDHNYRQSIPLRATRLQQEDIAELISELIEEYPGSDYDLLRRNCCHFADDFCQRLGVGRIPSWVHRLARLGAGLDGAFQAANAIPGKVRSVLRPGDRRAGRYGLEDDRVHLAAAVESLPPPMMVQPL